MIFDWHDDKSDECFRDRGFDFAYAAQLFEGEVEEFHDTRHDYGEARIRAFGRIEGRLFAVTYTDRENVRWIISAFHCRNRELRVWQRRDAEGR